MIGHEKVGNALDALGDPAAALVEYRVALAIGQRLAGLDPTNADWQSDLVEIHGELAGALRASGDLAGARKAYRKALAMAEALAARNATAPNLEAVADLRTKLSTL